MGSKSPCHASPAIYLTLGLVLLPPSLKRVWFCTNLSSFHELLSRFTFHFKERQILVCRKCLAPWRYTPFIKKKKKGDSFLSCSKWCWGSPKRSRMSSNPNKHLRVSRGLSLEPEMGGLWTGSSMHCTGNYQRWPSRPTKQSRRPSPYRNEMWWGCAVWHFKFSSEAP